MACEGMVMPGQTVEQRISEIKKALARLTEALAAGTVKFTVGNTGGVAFKNWKKEDRAGVSDVCAYQTLSKQRNPVLLRARATAEAQSGRKVNERVVAAGVHSHDGGKTWGSH